MSISSLTASKHCLVIFGAAMSSTT